MEIDREIIQLAPYNLYQGKWPQYLTDTTRGYINWAGRILNEEKPKTISSVVVTNYRQLRYKPSHLNFYTFGTFKKHYSVMKLMAELLADVYIELNILPIIKPILVKEWHAQEKLAGRDYHDISKSGFVTYSIEGFE
jgi:hypothetical protein